MTITITAGWGDKGRGVCYYLVLRDQGYPKRDWDQYGPPWWELEPWRRHEAARGRERRRNTLAYLFLFLLISGQHLSVTRVSFILAMHHVLQGIGAKFGKVSMRRQTGTCINYVLTCSKQSISYPISRTTTKGINLPCFVSKMWHIFYFFSDFILPSQS